jgi:hypothetical protein
MKLFKTEVNQLLFGGSGSYLTEEGREALRSGEIAPCDEAQCDTCYASGSRCDTCQRVAGQTGDAYQKTVTYHYTTK